MNINDEKAYIKLSLLKKFNRDRKKRIIYLFLWNLKSL